MAIRLMGGTGHHAQPHQPDAQPAPAAKPAESNKANAQAPLRPAVAARPMHGNQASSTPTQATVDASYHPQVFAHAGAFALAQPTSTAPSEDAPASAATAASATTTSAATATNAPAADVYTISDDGSGDGTDTAAATDETSAANVDATGSPMAADPLTQATYAYEDAKQDYDAAESQLQTELASFGSALTEEQKQAYTEQYMEDNKAVYDAEKQAAEDLVAALDDPAVAANEGEPAVQHEVKSALTALAGSTSAEAAATWIADNVTDKGNGAASYGLADDDVKTIIDNAGQNTSDQTGFETFMGAVSKIKSSLDGFSATTAVIKSWDEFAAALDQAVASKSADALNRYFEKIGKQSDQSAQSKAAKYVLAATYVAGGAFGMVDSDAGVLQTVQNWFILAAGGSDALKTALESGDTAFVEAVSDKTAGLLTAESATDLAKVLGTVDKVFSGVLNAMAIVDAGVSAFKDPKLSSFLAVAAALVAVIPSPIAPGISVALSVAASLVEGNEKWEAARERLQDIGFSENQAGALAGGGDAIATALDAGLSEEQIQALAEYPGLFGTAANMDAFLYASEAMGLSDGHLLDFAAAIAKDGNQAFYTLQAAIEDDNMAGEHVSKEAVIEFLATGPLAGASEFYGNKNPDGAAAEQERQAAESDFDTYVGAPGNSQKTVAELLAANDSAAYQAELIDQVVHEGDGGTAALELHAQDAAENGNAEEKEAFADALKAAEQAGVIDQETMSACLEILGGAD